MRYDRARVALHWHAAKHRDRKPAKVGPGPEPRGDEPSTRLSLMLV